MIVELRRGYVLLQWSRLSNDNPDNSISIPVRITLHGSAITVVSCGQRLSQMDMTMVLRSRAVSVRQALKA